MSNQLSQLLQRILDRSSRQTPKSTPELTLTSTTPIKIGQLVFSYGDYVSGVSNGVPIGVAVANEENNQVPVAVTGSRDNIYLFNTQQEFQREIQAEWLETQQPTRTPLNQVLLRINGHVITGIIDSVNFNNNIPMYTIYFQQELEQVLFPPVAILEICLPESRSWRRANIITIESTLDISTASIPIRLQVEIRE